MTTLTRQDLNFGQGRDAGPAYLGGEGGRGPAGFPEHTGFCPLAVVADVLCEFLEVAVHLILYVREVYPVGIFQKRKKYNVPVQVSPHSRLGATGSHPNHRVGREWILKFCSTFRPSPLSAVVGGLASQVLAATGSHSHPSLQWFISFYPLGTGSSPPEVRDQAFGLELPWGMIIF